MAGEPTRTPKPDAARDEALGERAVAAIAEVLDLPFEVDEAADLGALLTARREDLRTLRALRLDEFDILVVGWPEILP